MKDEDIKECEKWLSFRDDTYAQFSYSISKWPITSPQKVSFQIQRLLYLQKKRLDYHGIRLESYNIPDKFSEGDDKKENFILLDRISSNHNHTFNNQLYYKIYTKNSLYYKDGTLIRQFKNGNILYGNVTSVNNQETVINKNSYCPNCGNLLSVKELLEGCSYCQSKFRISDLYPVVTNFYSLPYVTSDSVLSPAVVKVLSFIFTVVIEAFLLTKNLISNPFDVHNVIISLIFSPIIYLGMYYLVTLSNAILVSFKFVNSLSYNSSSNNFITKRKIESFMCKYDPNFTYNLFEGKIVSMLRETIFSDDLSNLNIYQADNKTPFIDIIDCQYRGGVHINKLYEKDGKVYLDLDLYMYNTIYKNDNINKEKQTFRVLVERKSNVITTSDFRIDGINCRNCGAIVDVNKYSKCNHCGSVYELDEYEFVLRDVYIK